jgi:hypothetical protein
MLAARALGGDLELEAVKQVPGRERVPDSDRAQLQRRPIRPGPPRRGRERGAQQRGITRDIEAVIDATRGAIVGGMHMAVRAAPL